MSAITELAGAREVLAEYDKVVERLRAENERLREALGVLQDRLWPEDDENRRVIDAALKEPQA